MEWNLCIPLKSISNCTSPHTMLTFQCLYGISNTNNLQNKGWYTKGTPYTVSHFNKWKINLCILLKSKCNCTSLHTMLTFQCICGMSNTNKMQNKGWYAKGTTYTVGHLYQWKINLCILLKWIPNCTSPHTMLTFQCLCGMSNTNNLQNKGWYGKGTPYTVSHFYKWKINLCILLEPISNCTSPHTKLTFQCLYRMSHINHLQNEGRYANGTPYAVSHLKNGRSIYASFWNQYQTAHYHTRCWHFNASTEYQTLITCRIRDDILKVHLTLLVISINGRSIYASFWNQYATAHHYTRCWHFNASAECQTQITCRIRDDMLKVQLTPLVIYINGRSIYASFWNEYQTAHHHTRCWHFNASTEYQTLITCRIRDDILKVHLTLLVISINGRSIYASFWNQNATAHHYTRCWHFNASAECQTQITCRRWDDMLNVQLTPLVIYINGRSIYASFWNEYQTAHHHTRCWHFNASAECQTLITCRIRHTHYTVSHFYRWKINLCIFLKPISNCTSPHTMLTFQCRWGMSNTNKMQNKGWYAKGTTYTVGRLYQWKINLCILLKWIPNCTSSHTMLTFQCLYRMSHSNNLQNKGRYANGTPYTVRRFYKWKINLSILLKSIYNCTSLHTMLTFQCLYGISNTNNLQNKGWYTKGTPYTVSHFNKWKINICILLKSICNCTSLHTMLTFQCICGMSNTNNLQNKGRYAKCTTYTVGHLYQWKINLCILLEPISNCISPHTMLTFQCLYTMSHSNNLQNKGWYTKGTPYTVSHFNKWKINLCILLKPISNCASPHTMLTFQCLCGMSNTNKMQNKGWYAKGTTYTVGHLYHWKINLCILLKWIPNCTSPHTMLTFQCLYRMSHSNRLQNKGRYANGTPYTVSHFKNGRSIYASFWNQYQTAHHHTRCWHFNASAECQTLIRCRIRDDMLKVPLTPLVVYINGRSIYASFWNEYQTAHHHTRCWHFNASTECHTVITCGIRDDILKVHLTLLVISINGRSIYASFWNQYQTAHHHTRCWHFNASTECQTLITCRIRHGMVKVHTTPLVISINGRSIYASFWNQYATAHHYTRCWHFNASAECQTQITCRIREDMLMVHLTPLVI